MLYIYFFCKYNLYAATASPVSCNYIYCITQPFKEEQCRSIYKNKLDIRLYYFLRRIDFPH